MSISIAKLRPKFIKFADRNEANAVKIKFYEIAGFPGVIGAIDGTHVPIKSPGGNTAELFRNRKGFMSINVQGIYNADLLFTDLVVCWPGFVHDCTIFNNSTCGVLFETERLSGVLLGDNGYALKPYLMTPLLNPSTIEEIAYNRSHSNTRNVI